MNARIRREYKKTQATKLLLICFTSKIFSLWNFFSISVAIQAYIVNVFDEQVILGNDVLLKCNIPSFQADFVSVESWVDSEGVSIQKSELFHGNFQDMQLLG